jgi:hypothetical protein
MRDGQQPEAALRARLSLENGEVLTADGAIVTAASRSR